MATGDVTDAIRPVLRAIPKGQFDGTICGWIEQQDSQRVPPGRQVGESRFRGDVTIRALDPPAGWKGARVAGAGDVARGIQQQKPQAAA